MVGVIRINLLGGKWCKRCKVAHGPEGWTRKGECKARKADTDRRWLELHPERKAETNRRWYEQNKERKAETSRRWREQNPEKEAETSRRWYEQNKERKAEMTRRWREQNPEKAAANRRVRSKRREQRERSSPPYPFRSNHPDYAPRESLFVGCAYCGWLDEMSADHVVALSRGGTNHAQNILWVCMKCQRSKNNKHLFTEWTPPGPPDPELLYFLYTEAMKVCGQLAEYPSSSASSP